MNKAFKAFKLQGLIGWLDTLFPAIGIFQAFRGDVFHEPTLALLLAGISLPFFYCAIVSFSAAGHIRRLPLLTWHLITAGLFNIGFGILSSFGAHQTGYFYMFLIMGILNLVASQSRIPRKAVADFN